MTPRKRWYLAIVVVAIVAVLVVMLRSETVLRFGAAAVAGAVPGLELHGVAGSLGGGVSIERIRWSRGRTTVVVSRFETDWRFWPALMGRLVVRSMRADSVTIERAPRDGGRSAATADRQALPGRIDLPVLVHVGTLEIGQMSAPGFELRAIRGRDIAATNDGFAVRSLVAGGEPLSFELSGTLTPRGDWPLHLDARWRLALADRPELVGTLRADGGLAARVAVRLQADGAGTATWTGDMVEPVSAPRVAGRLVLRDAELYPEIQVSANLRLDGWISSLAVAGDVVVVHDDQPRLSAELDGRWGQGSVEVRRLVLGADGIDGGLEIEGRYDWSQTPVTGAAEARWHGLRAPVGDGVANIGLDAGVVHVVVESPFGDDPEGRVELVADIEIAGDGSPPHGQARLSWSSLDVATVASDSGAAEVTGSLDDWTATLETAIEFGALEPLVFESTIRGGRKSLRAEKFEGDWLEGTLVGQVSLDWSDALRGEVDLRLAGIDAGRIEERWPGRIGGRLRGTVMPGAAGIEWRATLDEADGEIRAMRFEAAVSLDGTGATVETMDARVSIGESEFVAHGRLGDTVDLTWSLSAPDLGRLDPRFAGSIEGDGRFAGTVGSPAISFDVDATGVSFEGYRVESVTGRGMLDLRDAGASDFVVAATGVRIRERFVESTQFEVAGPSDELRIAVAVRANEADLAIVLEGAWADAAFDGRLAAATISADGFPPWALENPAGLAIARDAVRVESACWSQQDMTNRACVRGAWHADTDASFAASLVALPLDRLSAWLPTGFRYEGELSGEATLEWHAGSAPAIDGRLSATPGAWRQFVRGEPVALLTWREAVVEGGFRDGTARARMRFTLEDGGELDADLEIPAFDNASAPAGDRPLRARVVGTFSDFDLLPAFVPDVGSVAGRVRTDLNVTGTPNVPLIGGTIVIEDGTTTIPRLGLRLTELQLAVDGGQDSVGVRAQARSGEGKIAFDGRFAIRDGDVAGEGNLNGENFTTSNIPEARVAVSPAVTLRIDGHSVRVDGTVAVPFARIEPRDLTGGVAVSADQTMVDRVGEEAAKDEWRIGARIRMTMGDVRFEGFGLTAKVTGALTAIDEPDLPTRATGELQVEDGVYAAWGQQLEIETGRLVFTGGSITDPGLDIRATRRPEEDVLVGVNIRGTLREPELRLFSEPAMQQSEQLSWLVLGIPLAQSGGSEQALLDNTANTAGLAGGGMVLRALGRRLGIGEIGIDRGDAPDQAELVIGRYLSPRFYIAYGIGIFDPSNSVRLRFHIDRRWSIEAESGQESTSTDLLYSIER